MLSAFQQFAETNHLISKSISILIILILAWICSKLLKKVILRHFKVNTKFILRMKNIIVYSIALYGILSQFTALENIMKALLASGGVIAVVLGLAAQEAMSNFVNGLMITTFKPFKIGDLIKVNNGELTGTVVDISLRHTVIQTYENTKIVIPNSVMNKAILENVSSVGNQKANFLEIGISYESDIEKAMRIIEEEIVKHPDYLDIRKKEEKKKQPAVITRLIDFADSSMHLKTTVYSKDNSQGFAMLSDLRIAIKKRFDEEGIEIPYPHQTILYKDTNKESDTQI